MPVLYRGSAVPEGKMDDYYISVLGECLCEDKRNCSFKCTCFRRPYICVYWLETSLFTHTG